MSKVSEWLEANAEQLYGLAETSGFDMSLVKLIAILALADLDDDQIAAQLFGHRFCLEKDNDWIPHLSTVLSAIRALQAGGPTTCKVA